jgi:microcystin-dependent protein
MPWFSNTIPVGWLLMNNQAVSRTTYARLFSIIGTIGGNGDGSTTFNIIDMRGFTLAGYDSSQSEFNAIAKIFGEKYHILTISEIPVHDHGISQYDNAMDGYIYPTNREASGQYGGKTGSTGGGQSHNNIQPTRSTNWIIKY